MKTYYISDNSISRAELAKKLGNLISKDADFEAYEATPGDDYHFVLDRGNNWRVFFEKDNKTVGISYRYGEERHPEVLAIFDSYFQRIK